MTIAKKLRLGAATLVMLLIFAPSANAANFSDGETRQVQVLQKEYAALDKKSYNSSNLYQTPPNLAAPFSSGVLKADYIKSQLDYINYYRSLFGLNAISADEKSNQSAQQTAAVMAAINANPFINQHGLRLDKRPSYINKSLWKLAQDTSETSNLNFNVNDQSAGDVITDLLTDHYNLTGADTGHRAWILSTKLSSTGIGAAYGTNGYRYSVQKVLNVDDLFKVASQSKVIYPSAGVFPIELAEGKNIAWSLYLSNQAYSGTPKIKITDKDTGKTYSATNVANYSKAGYGNFKTVITYSPGKTPIVAGHEYAIKIGKLDSYSFKLFRLGLKTVDTNSTTYQRSVQQDTKSKSAFSKTNSKLWATLHPKAKHANKKGSHYFDRLRKDKWHQNFF